MPDILMPQLSDSMESGLLLSWLIEDGQAVEVGDELLEVETDKATMAVQAAEAGVLEIVVGAGASVPVGELIARVGDRVGHLPEPSPEVASEPAAAAPPALGSAAANPAVSPAAVNGTGATFGEDSGAPSPNGHGGPATPVARRLARAHGVELEGVAGTGPRGRITKEDVLAAAGIDAGPMPGVATPQPRSAATRAAPPVPSPQPEPASPASGSLQPLNRLQQVVARRMAEATATVPHFQVQTEAAMDAALALRAQLKAAVPEGTPAPSVNDLIVKAAALALTHHPLANGSYTEAGFQLHDRVHVGVAVAAEGVLVVPTVRDTDAKSLGTIAAETRGLAEKVRSGTVTPAELSGATFTVSNLGMFQMTAITPVINPPQAAILGVGAVRQVLAREDGEIVDRSLVTLTLSCDHRILYGADASRFLAEIRELLEHPFALCL
jgi:pyruvate dehydrogenase E2 component (dihydrolipoamide acetyltransferase)